MDGVVSGLAATEHSDGFDFLIQDSPLLPTKSGRVDDWGIEVVAAEKLRHMRLAGDSSGDDELLGM
jgi:hypothetical protein